MYDDLLRLLVSILGKYKRNNERTGQVQFDCPACSAEKNMPDGDGKGNLEVNYYKGVYKCWACAQTNHMSGGIYYLIKSYGSRDNMRDFVDIAKELQFDLDFKTTSGELITELPQGWQSLLNKSKNPEYLMAMSYLADRKIGRDLIEKFNLGYCSSGKYIGRIIIPSYDANGKVNYFSGRAYRKGIWPKYLNPDTDKTTIIFNEHKINWDATIYLVEGPFDHIVVPNSIPLLGKYLDFDYMAFEMIYDKAAALIVIVLDGDAQRDTKRLYFKLNNRNLHNRVKAVLTIPFGYDISKIHELLGNSGVLKALRGAKRIPDYLEIF